MIMNDIKKSYGFHHEQYKAVPSSFPPSASSCYTVSLIPSMAQLPTPDTVQGLMIEISAGGGTQLKSQSPTDRLHPSINTTLPSPFNCAAGFPHQRHHLSATHHNTQIGHALTDWIFQAEALRCSMCNLTTYRLTVLFREMWNSLYYP